MAEFEVHASAVAIKEAGVLIRGASGSGKSRLALALISAACTAGAFARLIGDDRIRLERRGERLIARGHPLILGQIEQRGAGIVRLPFLPAGVIRLVVDLVEPGDAPRTPEPASDCAHWQSAEWDFRGLGRIDIAGLGLPALILPDAAAAADLALSILTRFRLPRLF